MATAFGGRRKCAIYFGDWIGLRQPSRFMAADPKTHRSPGAARRMSWLELASIFVGTFVVAAALTVSFVLVARLLGLF
jgi:hypothetical protein